MIFLLLKKYWKYLFDLLIIGGLIILVFLINPFNIFKGGLHFHSTANNVTAIREIGELVTAEYYGEAISTINQARLELIYADSVNATADNAFIKIKKDLLDVYSNLLKEKVPERKETFLSKLTDKLVAIFVKSEKDRLISDKLKNSSIAQDDLSKMVLEFYFATNKKDELKPEKDINPKERIETLTLLFNEMVDRTEKLSSDDFDSYLKMGLPNYNNRVFSDYYYDKKKAKLPHKEERKQLAMIGRGWVKAGFNFGNLDDRNFFFDKEHGIVYLFGVHAEILNADINPWFIPEKKIPGFQIINANRNVNFEDAVLVKSYCIDKLRKMAIDAGILKQAEEQGKETLKSFIGLLTGTEIKEVYFYYDNFTVLSREILNDEFISYQESRMLDTLIEQQIDTIIKLGNEKTNFSTNQKLRDAKIQQMKASIAILRKAFFEDRGRYYNRMSSLIFRVTADSILTRKELEEIKKYRWNIESTLFDTGSRDQIKDSIWYDNPLTFISEYNNAIDEILHKTKNFGELKTIHVRPDKKSKKSDIKIPDTLKISTSRYDKDSLITYVDSLYEPNLLTGLKYPINISSNWKAILEKKANITTIRTSNSAFIDTLIVGIEVQQQINRNKKDTIPVIFDHNSLYKGKYWGIRAKDISIPKEQCLILEYFINYYKNNNLGPFARSSNELKKWILSAKNNSSGN